MVERESESDAHHPPAPFWENPYHVHGKGFFSTRYSGRGDLFEGLKVWEDDQFRKLQGTVPVINISLKSAKEKSYESMVQAIGDVVYDTYGQYRELLKSDRLETDQKEFCQNMIASQGKMDTSDIKKSVKKLSQYLYQHYGEKPIILIDEYDAPYCLHT